MYQAPLLKKFNDSIDSKSKISSDTIPEKKQGVRVNMSFEKSHLGDKLYDNTSDECFTQNTSKNKYDENVKKSRKKNYTEEQITSQDSKCVFDSSSNGNLFEKSVKKKSQTEFFSEGERTFGCEAVETDKTEIPKYTSPWKSRKEKKKQKKYQAEEFSSATECEVAEDRLKENLNAKKKKHLQGEQIISQDLECVHDSSLNGNIFEKSVKKNKKEFISEAERTFGCEAIETEIPNYTTPQKSNKEKKKQKEYQAEDRLKENLSIKKKKHLQGEQIISQDLECIHDSSSNGNIFEKSVKKRNKEEFISEAERKFGYEAVETDKIEIPKHTSPRKSCKEKKKQKEYLAEDRLQKNLNAKKKHLQGEQIISQDLECVPEKIGDEFYSKTGKTSKCEVVETDNSENPGYIPIKKLHEHKRKQKEYVSKDFMDFLAALEYEVTDKDLKENLNTKKKKCLGKQTISQDLECVHDSSTNGKISKKSVPKKKGEEFSSKAEETFESEVAETDNSENPGYIPIKKSHKHKRKRKEYLSRDFLAAPEYEMTEKELKENLSTKKKKHLRGKQIISQDLECVHNSSTNGKNSKKSVPEKNGEEFSSEAETISLSEVFEVNNLENSNYDLFSQSISLDFEPAPVNFSVPLLHKHEKLSVVTAEMKESLRENGVLIKYGRFSEEEDTILQKNYQQFVEEFGIDDPCLLFGIGLTTRNSKVVRFLKAKHFYIRLGKGLENRTLLSIYKRARTLFNPLRSSKRFKKEEIAKLKHSYNFLGSKWTKIGNIVGRSDMNCQVSYRWHAKDANKGKWSSEEENNLIIAIKTVAQTDDISSNNIESISWDAVERLVPTRNAFQCRLYWGEHLAWDPSVTEKKPWNRSSYAKLIHLLKYKYCASSEREINWKELQKYFIDVSPSYIFLNRKWAYLNYKTQKKTLICQYSKMLDYLYKIYEKYIDVASFEVETSNCCDQ
ncbi:transcription termination factor 1 [Trichonephila inaurata madagascariensis]|uniref:Transcription termination factor 1 n=1 Tax=Trichonephila inaurata madagascariensis TaxID=2747483 RepID=A0A8X7CDS2_9ARAC|nr:transcription termination factor 1 [Trichonephila inaurata madagascariensis]